MTLKVRFFLVACFLLAGCAQDPQTFGPRRPTSRPYVVEGKYYIPQLHYELEEEGLASHYGARDGCHGSLTSTGDRFDMFELTAAHKTLPIPCLVQVFNLENGRSLILKITDRGPFVGTRILDVSSRAAHLLGFYHKGLARVKIKTLVPESLALPENRPGYKRSTTLLASAIDRARTPLFPQTSPGAQNYLVIKASSLAQALSIEETLKKYGPTSLTHHPSRTLCVLLGPLRDSISAQALQKTLSPHYKAVLFQR